MCFWLKSPLADTGSEHIWNVIVDSICKQVTVILFYSTTSLHIVGHRKAQGRHQTLCLGSELYLEGSVLKCSCESGIDFFFFSSLFTVSTKGTVQYVLVHAPVHAASRCTVVPVCVSVTNNGWYETFCTSATLNCWMSYIHKTFAHSLKEQLFPIFAKLRSNDKKYLQTVHIASTLINQLIHWLILNHREKPRLNKYQALPSINNQINTYLYSRLL